MEALRPEDLAADDDILSDVLIDSALGFQTHKCARTHTRTRVDLARLEDVMLQLACDDDVEAAFRALFGARALVPPTMPRSDRMATAEFKAHALRWVSLSALPLAQAIVCAEASLVVLFATPTPALPLAQTIVCVL